MSKPQMARMPWYPRDFASSTRGWPLIARAVYRELLDLQWDMGGLPAEPVALRAIVGASPAEWKRVWPIVEQKFQKGQDGKLRNPRLEAHREEALEKSRKSQGAAAIRWGKSGGGSHASA